MLPLQNMYIGARSPEATKGLRTFLTADQLLAQPDQPVEEKYSHRTTLSAAKDSAAKTRRTSSKVFM